MKYVSYGPRRGGHPDEGAPDDGACRQIPGCRLGESAVMLQSSAIFANDRFQLGVSIADLLHCDADYANRVSNTLKGGHADRVMNDIRSRLFWSRVSRCHGKQ